MALGASLHFLDTPGAGHIFSGLSGEMVERIIDFSQVPPVFRLSFSAACGAGGSFGTIQFRVGGTHDVVSDGTLIWTLAVGAGDFTVYGSSTPITNIWTGPQLFKVVAVGGGSIIALTPTTILFPG